MIFVDNMWSSKQIGLHSKVAKKLGLIKDEVANFITKNSKTSEKECLDFIKKAYKRHGLVNDSKKEFAIVAFGKNTKEVHYFPKRKGARLKPNALILLDIWARLRQGSAGQARVNKKNAPYADMTWMFWYGKKVPRDVQRKWKALTKARDAAISEVKKHLRLGKMPRGLMIDRAAHDELGNSGHAHGIKHTIGHSLGFDHPHGKHPGINWKEYSPLLKNVAYTIEPGMYFKNFGMRTEIDFYVSNKSGVVITTPVQQEIEVIS